MVRAILVTVAVWVAGGAIGAPGARGGAGSLGRTLAGPRVGTTAAGRTTAPPSRGGSGSLGGYLGRPPSTRRSAPGSRFFPGAYGSRYFYDPFFYDPFLDDPFYSGYGRSGYSRSGEARDDWSERGNVQLRVEPRDVEVIVDGIPSAKGGRAALDLPAGLHHVEIRRAGYRPWTLDLEVKQGVRYRLEQRLERLPKEEKEAGADRPASGRFGVLRLQAHPADALVDLDGRFLGSADLLQGSAALQRISRGRHRLRVRREGYKSIEREIEVTAGEPAAFKVDLERK